MSLLAGLMPPSLGNVTFINNFLASTGLLLSLLPELLQNGNGRLGLLPTPVLPSFLGGSEGVDVPWGNITTNNTNYYEVTPNTGVTRYFNFTIGRAELAPDGYKTPLILVNGEFPGPLIEANWGDWIQVTVKNDIKSPPEGTALHWHGLLQKKTPWYDGVPSVSMCPIAPGETFTYKFQADLYGTSWYHSHYSAQYAGGLYGPMVIHGPTNYPKEAGEVVDLGPIVVSDFYHEDYYELVKGAMSNNPIKSQLTTSENTLIQGKGITNCVGVNDQAKCTPNAGLAKFDFKPGRTHRLRFINTSGQGYMVVSLDGHDMTVIANDFVPVKPYTVKQVLLFVGQRTDVLVTANARPSAYWLRVRQPILCALTVQPFGLAAVYYEGIDTKTKPRSLPHTEFIEPTLINCANDPLSKTEPEYPIALPPPQVTTHIDITQRINSTGHTLYEMNRQTFRANYNHPLLNLTYNGNTSYPFDPQWNVYNFGSNETMRIVFQNNVPFGHPMHIHGQNMYVVDEGEGSWNGRSAVRPSNPQRRDTQTLRPSGYLVVDLVADNPGVWPFHCHIAFHVSQGLYINVMQKPEKVNQPEIPKIMKESCDAWEKYSQSHVVEQIDSGLRAARKRNEMIRYSPF